MALRSHHLNGHDWDVFPLAEHVILLTLSHRTERSTSVCRHLAQAIESSLKRGIIEVVSSYDSVAVFFETEVYTLQTLLHELEQLPAMQKADLEPVTHEVPVCYDLGMDWDRLEKRSGRSRDEIMKSHSEQIYHVAMLGFLPGFIFLDGLNKELACERLDHPRAAIPAGSVGIGGGQAGIYGLSTPGGWNIIGRTPLQLFKPHQEPPVHIRAGDQVLFKSISRKDFNRLNEHEQGAE